MSTITQPFASSSYATVETPAQVAVRVLAAIADDSRRPIHERIDAAKAILEYTKL